MDNQLRELTGAKQNQPSGLPLSKEGAGQVADAVGEVAAKIHNNAALTVADMQVFAGNLEAAAEVEVGGRRFSVEQLRSIPDLRLNVMIWQEILSGNYERHEELTLLTPAVATALALFDEDCLSLNNLTSLDPETVDLLVGFSGDRLFLNGLTSLVPNAAVALAQFGGKYIRLNGLTSLDPDTAAALAGFGGIDLWLDGLTSLDLATAAALAGFGGDWIVLNGLTALDSNAVAALAHFPGTIHCQPAVKAQIDRYKSQTS